MQLEFANFEVSDLQFGAETKYQAGTLWVSQEALRQEILQDERVVDCGIDIVRPGDAVRTIHIVDVVEPRIKPSTGDYFGGLIGSLRDIGRGRTHVLRGSAVVTSYPIPPEEALLDMTGFAAEVSKFGKTCNVVVTPVLRENVPPSEITETVVKCGLRAAVHLARATLTAEPADVAVMQWDAREQKSKHRPRTGYIYYLYSHGYGRELYLFGKSTVDILPTIAHPNALLDGGIVFAGPTVPFKSVSYNHMNNGTLHTFHRYHQEQELDFGGVIVVNHNRSFADKQRSAELAAHLARDVLGCDGVVISKDGGGQADVDLAECCERCEERGLKTVLLARGTSGDAGGDPVVIVPPRGDAIVLTANAGQSVQLTMTPERVIGGETLYDGTPADTSNLTTLFTYIIGAGDAQGGTLLSCREF